MTKPATKRPVQLDHHHFGKGPSDPNFSLRAARKAHADVMARWDDPVEGDDFKALMLHTIQNATAQDIEAHKPQIQAFLNRFFGAQRQQIGKALVRMYVASSVAAAQEFRKDQWQESYWRRGRGGRFAGYTGPKPSYGYQKVPTQAQAARAFGYGGSYAQHAQQQMMLAQAAQIAGAATSGRQQEVKWQMKDRKGNVRSVVLPAGQMPKARRGETFVGQRGAGLKGEDLTVGDYGFNLLQALGAPASMAAAGTQVPGAVNQLGQAWDQQSTKYGVDTATGAAFSRIKAGSDALHTIGAAMGPTPVGTKAKVAAAIGRYVGEHGEGAETWLGPHARKTGYKYRGVEREPRDLPERGEDEQQYHDRLVARISGHIPSRQIHELNLASGFTAPSHGYLRDRKGNVITEAHGAGDDHYLPFKLSGMTRMKDGSYIRTRSTGGPTTEDIYAASVSGAKKFTVVSRQGTYEVAFDPEFTHSKRFGDIALGMSRRYGHILDAVASGQVKAYGEVSDKQLAQFEDDALNNPDIVPEGTSPTRARALAREHARTMAAQQESEEGRTLSLDGEGYNYALSALASQYPYYLHYAGERAYGEGLPSTGRPTRAGRRPPGITVPVTGYTRPQHTRFADIPEEGGAHLTRVGNASERDSGYVKARHIKSADALVGYFDPSIAGAAEQRYNQTRGQGEQIESQRIISGGRTALGGKVRGDVAHYQNWAHNPYNRPNAAPAPTSEGAPISLGGTRTAGNGIGGSGATAGHRPTNLMQGSGYNRPAEISAEADAAYNKLQEYARVKGGKANMSEEHRTNLGPLLNRERFNQAWNEDKGRVISHINNAISDERGMTGLQTRHHDDETADIVNDAATNQANYHTMVSVIEHPESEEIREHLNRTIARLPEDHPAVVDTDKADLEGAYDPYMYVDRDHLLDAAYPNDPNGRERAAHLLAVEDAAYAHEQANNLLDDAGNGSVYRNWARRHPELSSAEEAQLAGSEEERGYQARSRAVNAVYGGLDAHLAEHHADEPSEAQFPSFEDFDLAHRHWERKRQNLRQAIDEMAELRPESDEMAHQKAARMLGHVLRNHEEVGNQAVPVPVPGGGNVSMTLAQLHRRLRPEQETAKNDVPARFTVSKRADHSGRWSIRRVA